MGEADREPRTLERVALGLLGQALELDGAARREFLDRECGSGELRQELESLLEEEVAADDDFLEVPAAAVSSGQIDEQGDWNSPTVALPKSTDGDGGAMGAPRPPVATRGSLGVGLPGQRIGPYLLQESLGEGGMGTVFLADQEHPVQRKVAVKILKPWLGSSEVLNRFAAERQALALMNHRNIAKIYDAGMTGDGLSYFAMEHIDGESITTYCDRCQLKVRDRIVLFLQVCEAIQHAHQKGIIHRDIKPSNVLVTESEGRPEVKVIDFGIAKAVGFALTEETLQTQLGYVVGTLEYMSPEQASLGARDLDTRSDVYSLGILLHELVTGVVPFRLSECREPAAFLLQKTDLTREPPKPSSRVSSQREGMAEVAERRSSSVRELAKAVRGDLDWIMLRALENAPARRYPSAHELHQELERYLDNEVVLAGPPSIWYRVKKVAARHKMVAILTVFSLAAFTVAFIGVTFGLIETRKANAKAQSTVALLEELLLSVDPEQQGPDLKVVSLLAGFEGRLQQVDDVEIRARLQETFGNVYSALGKTDKAVEQFLRILETLEGESGEPLDPELRIHLLNQVSRIRLEELPSAEMRDEIRDQLGTSRRALGPTHPETLVAQWNLASIQNKLGENDEALVLVEELRESNLRQRGPAHRETLRTQMLLARVLKDLGRFEQALEVDSGILETSERAFGDEHPRTLTARGNVANGLIENGEIGAALDLLSETLALAREVFGPRHPKALWILSNIAETYSDLGRYDEALVLQEELLAGLAESYPADHLEVQWAKDGLARTYLGLGRDEESVKISIEVIEVLRRDLGADYPETLRSIEALASAYGAVGRLGEASELASELLEARSRVLGQEHPETRYSLVLAAAFEAATNSDGALPRFDASLPSLESDLSRAFALEALLDVLRQTGQEALAGPYYARLKQALEGTIGLEAPRARKLLAHDEAFRRAHPEQAP